MSCKVCSKDIFYETHCHYPDGGYGDNDYISTNKHQVNKKICPQCGRIYVDNHLNNEEKDVRLTETLAEIIAINSTQYSSCKNLEQIHKEICNKALEKSEELKQNFLRDSLKEMGLEWVNNGIKCKCGNILIQGEYLEECVNDLIKNRINFCSCCGNKVNKYHI